jgi:hypothetical protein
MVTPERTRVEALLREVARTVSRSLPEATWSLNDPARAWAMNPLSPEALYLGLDITVPGSECEHGDVALVYRRVKPRAGSPQEIECHVETCFDSDLSFGPVALPADDIDALARLEGVLSDVEAAVESWLPAIVSGLRQHARPEDPAS